MGWSRARDWSVVFVFAFAVYALTASRGAQWQDSGWHILRIVSGELVHPLGLALTHPLHYWLGRAAIRVVPLEPCLTITLISSLAAAVAVANVYGCVRSVSGSVAAAIFAAASLGLAHTFWRMATVTEVNTITAALLAGECWCLARFCSTGRRRALWGMLLLNGLGLADHPLALLTTPVLAAVVIHGLMRRSVRGRDAAIGLALWIVGSAPYTGLVLTEIVHSGDVAGTVCSALFGHSFAGEVLNTSVSGRMLLISLGFAALNFPNLLLPLAGLGIARSRAAGIPMVLRRALAAGLLIHLVFALRYNVVDQFAFLVPSYVLLCVFGGLGFAQACRDGHANKRHAVAWAGVTLLCATPVVYAFVPGLARRFHVLQSVERHKPYRDDYVYLFTPWSIADRSAERMSREAVRLASTDGLIVVEDDMASFAIRYRRLRDKLTGVTVGTRIDPAILGEAMRDDRPVVLVPKNTSETPMSVPAGRWARSGDLYILKASDVQP